MIDLPCMVLSLVPRLDSFWTVAVWMPLWKPVLTSSSIGPELLSKGLSLEQTAIHAHKESVQTADWCRSSWLHKPNPCSNAMQRKLLVEGLGSEEVLLQALLCFVIYTKENAPSLLELIRPQPTVRKHDNSHSWTGTWLAASWWQLSHDILFCIKTLCQWYTSHDKSRETSSALFVLQATIAVLSYPYVIIASQ